jgi:hypothetical protein
VKAPHLFELYVIGAVLYAAFVIGEIAMSPFADKVWDSFVESWEQAGKQWCGRPLAVLIMLGYAMLWPFGLLWRLTPSAITKALDEKVARNFRRQILDRNGLLTPQMPAPRCPMCNTGMDKKRVHCVSCKNDFDLDHCDICCKKSPSGCVLDVPWICYGCRPIPMPKPMCHLHNKELVYNDVTCKSCGGKMLVVGCADCAKAHAESGAPPLDECCFKCRVKRGEFPGAPINLG